MIFTRRFFEFPSILCLMISSWSAINRRKFDFTGFYAETILDLTALKDEMMDDKTLKVNDKLSSYEEKPIQYALLSVVFHVGTESGGHYVSIVRHGAVNSKSSYWKW